MHRTAVEVPFRVFYIFEHYLTTSEPLLVSSDSLFDPLRASSAAKSSEILAQLHNQTMMQHFRNLKSCHLSRLGNFLILPSPHLSK
jgi:hypothetical protein